MWASDLGRPLHEFLGCSARVIASAAPAGDDDDRNRNFDAVHDRLLNALNGLASRSHRSEAVRLLPSRSSTRERFGDEQVPSVQPVWDWEPQQLTAGDQIFVGVPGEIRNGDEFWGLAVRDPRPPAMDPRVGPFGWDEPWDRLVRWSVPAPARDGGTRSLRFGRVVDLPGLYSLFVLVDRSGRGIGQALIGEVTNGAAEIGAFYQLLAKAASGPLGVDCYVRRYRVD